MTRARLLAGVLGVAAFVSSATSAHAGDFDALGRYVRDPAEVAFEDFGAPERFVPDDIDPACAGEVHSQVELREDALSGQELVVLNGARECPERFALPALPPGLGSYRATVWTRHGAVGARMFVYYPAESGLENVPVRMAPTGRTTSDGWVELATNAFTVDADQAPTVYLRVVDYADAAGVELDALELIREGEVTPATACEGVRDPVCGPEALCIYGGCRQGRYSVPPLPEAELRDAMVDSMLSRLDTFFGGKKTRLEDLPFARLELEAARGAETPWQFWNGMATAFRRLHDWHTSMGGAVLEVNPRGRLNACFVEGDADLSHAVFPRDPRYADLLVSHVGNGAAGLRPGDRLLAVDGLHPIEWARALVDSDWGWHVATDADSFADFAEALGGPTWSGGALMLKYARNITVLRCAGGTCDGPPETIPVADLEAVPGGEDVYCDNRPGYHFEQGGPDPGNHYVFGTLFRGRVAGTTPEEAIETMVWDTLYGGGEPQGYVNGTIRGAVSDWKANARGVILDHRAGNGGTIDAPQYLTELVRPPADLAVLPSLISSAGYDGPLTADAGVRLYESYPADARYRVGSAGYDPTLPVALVLHRDGSASDYLPEGMKGAPKVRLFSPRSTAGAFSTFIEFAYAGGISFQLASGDTITATGGTLIGKGVRPDEVVEQRQSDLVVGKDSLHEAALAWVRENLKPIEGGAQ